MRGFQLIAAAVVAIALSAAAPVASASDKGLKQLYAKAKAANETVVNIYSPYGNFQPLWDIFQQEYPGITVRHTMLLGPRLISRISAEVTSGNIQADMVMNGITDVGALAAQKRLAADVPPNVAELDPQFKDPNGLFQIPFRNLFTVVYNTQVLKRSELPKTLPELFSGKWAGKFGYAEFVGAGAIDICVATAAYNGAFKDAWLQDIKKDGKAAPSNTELVSWVAQRRVELAIYAPTQVMFTLRKDGAPLDAIYMPDSSIMFGPGAALIAGGPHPNATRLLKAWLFTPEAQKALATKVASYGTMPNAPVPTGLPQITGYHFKNLPLSKAQQILSAYAAKTAAIFGR